MLFRGRPTAFAKFIARKDHKSILAFFDLLLRYDMVQKIVSSFLEGIATAFLNFPQA